MPQLLLNSGGKASYTSGSGTDTLTFRYTVALGDNADPLDYVATNSLSLAGASIRDLQGANVDPTLPAPGSVGSLAESIVQIETAPVVESYRVLFGSQSFDISGSINRDLPWQIKGIQAIFSEPIFTASLSSLTGISATRLSGVGTNTLTWTFNPISIGTFTTSLKGTGSSALRDSLGNALSLGVDFTRKFKVLYGDFNGDGVVNSADMSGVFLATRRRYNPFADINGYGVIELADVLAVRKRIGTRL